MNLPALNDEQMGRVDLAVLSVMLAGSKRKRDIVTAARSRLGALFLPHYDFGQHVRMSLARLLAAGKVTVDGMTWSPQIADLSASARASRPALARARQPSRSTRRR